MEKIPRGDLHVGILKHTVLLHCIHMHRVCHLWTQGKSLSTVIGDGVTIMINVLSRGKGSMSIEQVDMNAHRF